MHGLRKKQVNKVYFRFYNLSCVKKCHKFKSVSDFLYLPIFYRLLIYYGTQKDRYIANRMDGWIFGVHHAWFKLLADSSALFRKTLFNIQHAFNFNFCRRTPHSLFLFLLSYRSHHQNHSSLPHRPAFLISTKWCRIFIKWKFFKFFETITAARRIKRIQKATTTQEE